MKKLYTDLPEYISDAYISKLINDIEAEKDNEIELSWLSLGGSFWAGQKFISFLNSTEKQISANATGIIASMGAVTLPFFKSVKIANQADIMIHSVGGEQSNIDVSNDFIYNALAQKINEAKFKEITGHDLKKVLTAKGNERFEVWFTGKDAVEMGLADEGYDLLEKKNTLPKFNVSDLGYEIPNTIKDKYNNVKPEIKTDMDIKDLTVDNLKKENKAVFDAAFKEGEQTERKRVADIVKYASHNPEKMNELINSGREITMEEAVTLATEKSNLAKLNDLESNSPEDLDPAKVTGNKEKMEKEAAMEELRERLGIDKLTKNE